MHNLGWAPDLRDALSIPKSYGLIKGGVVCRVHLNILGSFLAWYKASGRVRRGSTADEWTDAKIPIKHQNLSTLHIVTSEKKGLLMRANRSLKSANFP